MRHDPICLAQALFVQNPCYIMQNALLHVSYNAYKAGKQSFQRSNIYMNDTTCMNEMQHGIYFAYSNKIQDLNILTSILQIRSISISMSLCRCIRVRLASQSVVLNYKYNFLNFNWQYSELSC